MGWSQSSLPWPGKQQREKGKIKPQVTDCAAAFGKAVRTWTRNPCAAIGSCPTSDMTHSPGACPSQSSEDKSPSTALNCDTWWHRQWMCPCYTTSVLKVKRRNLSDVFFLYFCWEIFLHIPNFWMWRGSNPIFISISVLITGHVTELLSRKILSFEDKINNYRRKKIHLTSRRKRSPLQLWYAEELIKWLRKDCRFGEKFLVSH